LKFYWFALFSDEFRGDICVNESLFDDGATDTFLKFFTSGNVAKISGKKLHNAGVKNVRWDHNVTIQFAVFNSGVQSNFILCEIALQWNRLNLKPHLSSRLNGVDAAVFGFRSDLS